MFRFQVLENSSNVLIVLVFYISLGEGEEKKADFPHLAAKITIT